MRLALVFLLLCCAGCRPLVAGKDRNPLLGEWEVERTEGPGKSFFILTLEEQRASIFSNGTKPGTYSVEGDRLSLRITGYPAETFTILRRAGGFDLRDDATGTTYFLRDRNGFDAMGFFGPLALGLLGLVVLVPEAAALRIYAVAGAWPRVAAKVRSARVESERPKRRLRRRRRGVWPRVEFTYAVADQERSGSNAAPHNHRASYTPAEAEAWVERWRKEGLEVRYDPRRPSEVFMGREHYPIVTSLLLALVGTALSLGLAAVAGVVAGWFNLEVVKVGTVDWPVFVVVAALPLYLLARRVLGR